MKRLKSSLTIMAAAVIVLGLGATAYAFHSGGVAECEGCHSMHTALSGALLIKNDIGSTCLACHEHAGDTGPSSYHVSTPGAELGPGLAPKQRTPGGDFGWLKKPYTFVVRGATINEDGATHGHNIIAVDNGYAVDPFNPAAPGGIFPSALLTCNSCHDQHGQYRRLDTSHTIAKTGAPIIASGSYHDSPDPVPGSSAVGVFRLLAGIGWAKNGVVFAVNPPAAVVNRSYNRTEASSQVRDAYGKSMGEWCATCHPNMHTNSGRLVHPVTQNFGSTVLNNYNAYVKSGDLTGVQATSFLSLVPYEENSTDYVNLKSQATYTTEFQPGPTAATAQVMCLSCHRAHATGWPEALRWMYQGEFIVYNGLWPGIDTTPTVPQFHRGRLAAETQAAYYDRPASKFATYQRMLCNKCHALD